MVQGSRKVGGSGGSRPQNGAAAKSVNLASAKLKQKQHKKLMAKVGNPTAVPKKKTHYNLDYIEETHLSKVIDKANEQKMAAKIIQDGGHLSTMDLKQKGKALNKEQRRSQVKRKLTRVEEKLRDLKAKAEREGMIDSVA